MSGVEEFRPVVDHEGRYEVSNYCAIRSMGRYALATNASGTEFRRWLDPRTMRPSINSGGYYVVTLAANDGVSRRHSVHVLVAAAFIGPRPAGHLVRHLDGNPRNNWVANLQYGTVSDNMLDSVAHGTHRNARATHCRNGHPYDEANTYTYGKTGQRSCRICNRAAVARRRARIRAVRPER